MDNSIDLKRSHAILTWYSGVFALFPAKLWGESQEGQVYVIGQLLADNTRPVASHSLQLRPNVETSLSERYIDEEDAVLGFGYRSHISPPVESQHRMVWISRGVEMFDLEHFMRSAILDK